MDAKVWTREAEKQQLLRQLVDLMVQEQRERGVYKSVPRYSQLEQEAHGLAEEVSRLAQERAAGEIAAASPKTAACPTCGEHHEVQFKKRTVTSIDGPVEIVEAVAHCRPCRRSFFPSA